MRYFQPLCLIAVGFLGTLVASAQDGVPARPTPSDYAVHESIKSAVVAAAVVPPAQVKKLFPGDAVKGYVVVEVAVYPQDGSTVLVDAFDFALKLGPDLLSHPRTPQEIASIWDEKNAPQPRHKVDVVTETGVVYTSGNDPVYGRSRGWGTYTGVGVATGGQGGPPPPPPSSVDPRAVQARVWAKALPEGPTARPVAGYIYFPIYSKKSKNAPLGLQYLKDGAPVDLPFPSK